VLTIYAVKTVILRIFFGVSQEKQTLILGKTIDFPRF